jgi:hypothetical protein
VSGGGGLVLRVEKSRGCIEHGVGTHLSLWSDGAGSCVVEFCQISDGKEDGELLDPPT